MIQLIRWQGTEKPQEQELHKLMQAQGLTSYAWSNGPGDRYPAHNHSYEKVLYCVSGSIRFVLPDQKNKQGEVRTLDLEPGDCMILPAGTLHSALVGPHGVLCLEAQRR